MRQSAPSNAVFSYIVKIPKGKVTTYQAIAKACGIKSPRYVGYILHHNPNPGEIPCHRCVRSDGTIADGYAFGGRDKQIKKLKEEGVSMRNNRIASSSIILRTRP